MIDKRLSFDLPVPWTGGTFSTEKVGAINFLVGPNGSGKSKFARSLNAHLENSRLLGTDRLVGMEEWSALRMFSGDWFGTGYGKGDFGHLKESGKLGSGIDTLVLLEEKADLRIQLEATLSHLFNRRIMLEWDSGKLIPRATLGESGVAYRLDRDECHGIKELLVLLTHLYNNEHSCLIIDEPELNLHPQYQAFFMQQVRQVAGDPREDMTKKIIFLVTHSPFILEFKSVDDLKSVISFSLEYSVPRHIFSIDTQTTDRLASLVSRLNVHYKQLFFSDNPIFVEGILDSQLVSSMQEARGVSVAGAGSCIIDVGGCEEVNKYLELCLAFGKEAHFLYDLDSLFGGNLRSCVRSDESVQSFLLKAGVGNDFGKYCGELERKLTEMTDNLFKLSDPPAPLARLLEFLRGLGDRTNWNSKKWARARVSVVTAISRYREDVVAVSSKTLVEDVEARLGQIVAALKARNINLLPGGALERYLPNYIGDEYELTDEAKQRAVNAEVLHMTKPMSESELSARYTELYEAICNLPSKVSVDVTSVLRGYLGRYIHELQAAITKNATWQLSQLQAHLNAIQPAMARVFSVHELRRDQHREFFAKVVIVPMLNQGRGIVNVNHRTNAGVGDFDIEFE